MRAKFTSRGSTKRTEDFLRGIKDKDLRGILSSYAEEGVAALIAATPRESGLAAESWGYTIEVSANSAKIIWTNSDVEDGFPVAIMLQHGYGTGTGGYVQGRDYINPAMKPVFDRISDRVWKEVTNG